MVSTRAMRARAPLAEEKKEDGDYNYTRTMDDDRSQPQSIETDKARDLPENDHGVFHASKSNNDGDAAPSPAADPPRPQRKSPLLLLLCASGITSCYLWYGTVQEHIFHMDNDAANDDGDGGGDNGSITLFLLATSTFSSFLLALIWTVVGPILLPEKKAGTNTNGNGKARPAVEGRLNHPLMLMTSLAYLSAMAASNESLHYVSYPTCVLAKSSKLIPTMVVGGLVDAWRGLRKKTSLSGGDRDSTSGAYHGGGRVGINAMEWIGAALITVGILAFQYVQFHKQSTSGNNHHGGKEAEGDSPYGLALLGLSLLMDGVLGACQSALKRKSATTGETAISAYRPPSAMETMLYINLYATLILLPASHRAGQLVRGVDILLSSDRVKAMLLLQLNLSASLGQVFIFLTIHHFSPLTCTTITTTRKFFTILLSVYKFGHVLDRWQWGSVGLVFGGLYLQIAAKLLEGGDGGGGAGRKVKEE